MNSQDVNGIAEFLFPGDSERKRVAEVLQTAYAAERICRLKYEEGEDKQDVCLQVHKDRILVFAMQEEESFSYELTEAAELKRACYYLLNCFELPERRSEAVPALFMSRRKYEELKEKADSYPLYFLTECLRAETGDLENSSRLAKVLKSRTAAGELRLCSRGSSGWSFQQASYIEDASGGWLLRMSCDDSQDWIIAVPLKKADLSSAFFEWAIYSAPVTNQE